MLNMEQTLHVEHAAKCKWNTQHSVQWNMERGTGASPFTAILNFWSSPSSLYTWTLVVILSPSQLLTPSSLSSCNRCPSVQECVREERLQTNVCHGQGQ